MAYIYRHIRLDKNIPFYIGIGSDNEYKRAHSKFGRNPIWKNIVSKTKYEIEIIITDIELPVAKIKEIEFISLYGRLNNGSGTLANITGGGDGWFDPPAESIERLIKRNKNNKHHFGKTHSAASKIVIGGHSSIRNAGINNPSYKGKIKAVKNGVFIGEYFGLKECANTLSINISCVSQCVNKKRNTAGGYTFTRTM